MGEVLSIAVMEPFEGKQEEFEQLLIDLYALLARKQYSRDELLRNKRTPHYVNIRHWTSEAARQAAQQDPDVHKYWLRLGLLCHMRAVYETLEPVVRTGAAETT